MPITVSQRELLAVSIDLRKKVKEFTLAEKVPTAPVQTFLHIFKDLFKPDTNGKTVAVVSDPGPSSASSPQTLRGYSKWKRFWMVEAVSSRCGTMPGKF
jgi:hypothetical protein